MRKTITAIVATAGIAAAALAVPCQPSEVHRLLGERASPPLYRRRGRIAGLWRLCLLLPGLQLRLRISVLQLRLSCLLVCSLLLLTRLLCLCAATRLCASLLSLLSYFSTVRSPPAGRWPVLSPRPRSQLRPKAACAVQSGAEHGFPPPSSNSLPKLRAVLRPRLTYLPNGPSTRREHPASAATLGGVAASRSASAAGWSSPAHAAACRSPMMPRSKAGCYGFFCFRHHVSGR